MRLGADVKPKNAKLTAALDATAPARPREAAGATEEDPTCPIARLVLPLKPLRGT